MLDQTKLYARPDKAVPSGVLIWRDSSLPRQHQDVEAPQRIHHSHVSLLCERGHQTDGKLMTIYCNHRVTRGMHMSKMATFIMIL